jgi:hypothetical protein
MGLVMDLRIANWVAHLIEPGAPVPRLTNRFEEREGLQYFLHQMAQGFVSSPERMQELKGLTTSALDKLKGRDDDPTPVELLSDLRRFMGGRPWTALLIPSGRTETDRYICSQKLLNRLVGVRPGCPGLILQPAEGSFNGILTLTDVFPAFEKALTQFEDWPGMLVWTRQRQSEFFPFPSEEQGDVENSSIWILSQLGDRMDADLNTLSRDYGRHFPKAQRSRRHTLRIIHLSDIHLGSPEADENLPRVHQIVRDTVKKVSDGSRILPLVTGDLMDDPDLKSLNSVRLFMDFLSNLGTEQPISLLGNHDVRKNGYLAENYRMVMRLPTAPAGVEWFDDLGVGLVCFNSVIGGKVAAGSIGDAQLIDVGNAIDRKPHSDGYTLIGALHHHPVPVAPPEWYQMPFYERFMGTFFERTESLEDADLFLRFVENRKMAAILHGHKHIPRIESQWNPRIPIYGCGSTVGKVKSKDGGAYMSMNIVTIDTSRGSVSGRLLVERVKGGRPEEFDHHEMIFGSRARQ